MLDKFRETFITWDKASKKVYQPLRVSGSDERGRKLVVQVVNDGVIEDLTGTTLALAWKTRNNVTGLDPFTANNPEEGIFELFYTNRMLENVGILRGNFVLIDATGRIVSEDFNITVTDKIDDSAAGSQAELSLLQQSLSEVSGMKYEISQKIGGGKKAELEDLSSEVISAIDGTGGPFNLLSVPQDKSVTSEKISSEGINPSNVQGVTSYRPNLFNKNRVNKTGYYSWDSGGFVESNVYYSSEYIESSPEKNHIRTLSKTYGAVFLDSEKRYISGHGTKEQTFLTPPETKYILLTVHKDDIDNTMLVSGNDLPPTYVSYVGKHKFDSEIFSLDADSFEDGSFKYKKLSKEDGPLQYIKEIKNHFNKNDIQLNGYINWQNGVFVSSQLYVASNPIKVKPNQAYIRTDLNRTYGVSYFDSSMIYIGGKGDKEASFTTPQGCAFIRQSVEKELVDKVMIIEGAVLPSEYIPFDLPIYNVSDRVRVSISEDLNPGSSLYYPVTTENRRDLATETDYHLTRIPHLDKDGNVIKIKRGFANDVPDGRFKETARNFANRKNATLTVNASFYDMSNNRLEGTDIYNGNVLNTIDMTKDWMVSRYILGIKEDNTLTYYPPTTDPQVILNDGVNDALHSFIPLISGGVKVSQSIFDNYEAVDWPYSRQVIAQYPNKDILIFTCEFGGKRNKGMDMHSVTRILLSEGVDFAFMLDGGGSAQTVVRGSLLNTPKDGNGFVEREVPDFLYFSKDISLSDSDKDTVAIVEELGSVSKKIIDLETKSDGIGSFDSLGQRTITDANKLPESGVFWFLANKSTNTPDITKNWVIENFKMDESSSFQIAHSVSTPSVKKTRAKGGTNYQVWADA